MRTLTICKIIPFNNSAGFNVYVFKLHRNNIIAEYLCFVLFFLCIIIENPESFLPKGRRELHDY